MDYSYLEDYKTFLVKKIANEYYERKLKKNEDHIDKCKVEIDKCKKTILEYKKDVLPLKLRTKMYKTLSDLETKLTPEQKEECEREMNIKMKMYLNKEVD